MYEGLYDTRKGLSEADASDIGAMTALLMLPWNQWVHRRVDRVTFTDEDTLCRDISIDFTLPHWFHDIRHTPTNGSKRQLVPLGFFRKEPLVNLSFCDDTYSSLPLLISPQTSQVAQAVLRSLADRALGTVTPAPLLHDMRNIIRQPITAARDAYDNLFGEHDPHWRIRQQLQRKAVFANTAALFCDGFLALTMLEIRRHERRVIHLSFEEQLGESGRFIRMLQQALGQPRRVSVGVTSPSSAASYHLEVEAPEGLMITDCVGYHYDHGLIERVPSTATLRRAHCHFNNAPPRSTAGVDISIHPRRSSIVRPATLTALLTLVATLAITLRLSRIEQGDNAAAAALLLAVTGIIGLIVARSGESEMATSLLLPLRVLAIVPAILGVFAAVIVVMDPTPSWVGYSALGLISALMALGTGLLILNWLRVNSALRARDQD